MSLSIRKWKLYVKMYYQYILSYKGVQQATFLDDNTCLDFIIQNQKSFIRFGDGEFDILEGKSIHYQKFSVELRERLDQILTEYVESGTSAPYFIGMPAFYLNQNGKFMWHSRLLLSCWSHTRYYFLKYYDKKVKYGDAFLFSKGREPNYKRLWDNAHLGQVIFVHNKKQYAEHFEKQYGISTTFIKIPSHNAFTQMDQILIKIMASLRFKDKKSMVILSAGPCGKVLAYELSKKGVWAVDTGHCWDQPLFNMSGD